jgi:mRNA interferase MazF
MNRAAASWWRATRSAVTSSSGGSGAGKSLVAGDIISALFPIHDPGGHEQEGYRPAVVVGMPERVGVPRFPVLIVAPMTSYRGQEWAERSPELYPRFDEGTANLRSPSVCLLDRVRALDAERVRGYRGTLSEEEYGPVREGLRQILGGGGDDGERDTRK